MIEPDTELIMPAPVPAKITPDSDYCIHDEGEPLLDLTTIHPGEWRVSPDKSLNHFVTDRQALELAIDWVNDLGSRSWTAGQLDYELDGIRHVMQAVRAGGTQEEWAANYPHLRPQLMAYFGRQYRGRISRQWVEYQRIGTILNLVKHHELLVRT